MRKSTKMIKRFLKILSMTVLFLIMAVTLTVFVSAADEGVEKAKLQNGSFEDGQTFTNAYSQPDQSAVPSWNTTAFQGKIELFTDNPNTYLTNPSVRLTPTDGAYAAELNADEESTLYQIVKTTPSSLYEWGLDHGARNGTDIMALVIGPKQSVNPSKPSKAGRDHFMQMIDWLNSDNNPTYKAQISGIKSGETPQKYTVFSKKFAADGTFEDNAGNNAFSLTPSTIYTEEWHIWIMASDRGKNSGEPNPWNHYGSNAEGSAGSSNGSGSTNVDLTKYYLYTVPAGQNETLFGFVSVGYVDSPTTADKAKTYGNFLDDINFQIYHPLSGSSSNHGSAVVGGSDGTSESEGSSGGHKITINDKLTTYIIHGEQLKIQAIIKKADADDGCEFVGLYRITQDSEGNPVTTFLQLAGNVIDDTGSLTDEEKSGKWLKSTNKDGDIIYTYYIDNVTSSTDLHFVFIKSPTITYDPNGGKPYEVKREHNTDEAANVYSFKPVANFEGAQASTNTLFIDPYVSHAAEGLNDGWKFMGWRLTGDTVENAEDGVINGSELGKMILSAEHTIACDYHFKGVNGDTKAQYFKVYDGNVTLKKKVDENASHEDLGVIWQDNGETKIYANTHYGITLVAQWRWRQAFIPQISSANGSTTDSDKGGTVEITTVIDKSDANYNAAYGSNGGKSYHAKTDEKISVKATPNTGYTFEGWYDESGNLVSTNSTYTYTETKESVKTYYARFSNSVTQTYIRQVKNGSTWEVTDNDTVGTLGRYTYTDAFGSPISSTATEGANYKFVGWYDADGNKVPDSMLANNGTTISYTTTDDATYYARFETAYTVKFAAQTKKADGSFVTDAVGGKVSVASVKGVNGSSASSKATASNGYKFLGWYDKNGNQLSASLTYSTEATSATNGVTYYARFEINYTVVVDSKAYVSFVAESENVIIPDAFVNRDAGTGKNTQNYGYDDKLGNTISTGFKYSITAVDLSQIKSIQITINVPESSYVKVCGNNTNSNLSGDGNVILADSESVSNNKGSIEKIKNATTITYRWEVSGLESGKTYGFVVDNLYAPGATATIALNGEGGKIVTDQNGVVNKKYKFFSIYKEILNKLIFGWKI